MEVRYEEGLEDGEEKGKLLNLIQLVMKKLQKEKSLEQIADEVEESIDLVEKISNAIRDVNTEDINIIWEKLKNKE